MINIFGGKVIDLVLKFWKEGDFIVYNNFFENVVFEVFGKV